MSSRSEVRGVCAWRDWAGDQPWSVSTEDSDGKEIHCLGGYDSEEDAWAAAREAADEYGVPATCCPYASGEATDTYTPEPDETEDES
jgi:hypothetical protein